MTVMSEMNNIKQAIIKKVITNLNLVGVKVSSAAKKEALDRAYDKGDFYRNIGYKVNNLNTELKLIVGSNVKHEPYVIGGKKPSWTPFVPIKSWVERKGLSWIDDIGNEMTIDQIAWAVIGKIKREGIEPRKIFKEILDADKAWILKTIRGE